MSQKSPKKQSEGSEKKQALEGLKVIDFSWVGTGPFIAKYLADFGAEVIKVESATHPDMTRMSMPYKDSKPGFNRSGIFVILNNNKYSFTLNVNKPQGIKVLKRLVSWADILIESFTPGRIEKWGLGYEQLSAINPGLIMVAISIQGQTGPYAKHPGFGWNIVGLAGFNHFTGWPDREPVGIANPYPDVITPPFGVLGILTALEYRRKTGKGQYIDLSQLEASLPYLSTAILDCAVNNRQETRAGNRSTYAVPHGVYRCKGDDRWCAIAVFNDKEWQAFCEVVDHPEWKEDVRFSTFLNRKATEDELNRLIEKWTVNHIAEKVMNLMQESGIAAGVVQNHQDLMENDPQYKHRKFFRTLNHPEMGTYRVRGEPLSLSETPYELRLHAPCLGEHTEYVCTEILGMSNDEFLELFNAGIFE